MPPAPIDERAHRHQMRAFVAHDTIEAIVARIEPMVRSGRRMTLMRRYLGSDEVFDFRTGLTLDTDTPSGGVEIRRQDNPAGMYAQFLLTHVTSFGVSAYAMDGDEDAVRARWHSEGRRREDCVLIRITGGADGAFGYTDKIEITRYNENGVGEQTIVVFDQLDGSVTSEADAAVLDALAATGQTWTPEALRAQAERLRYHWRTLPEDLAADPAEDD